MKNPYPLGVKIGGKKEGLWITYKKDGDIDSMGIYQNDILADWQKIPIDSMEYTDIEAHSGGSGRLQFKKGVSGWSQILGASFDNKKLGLWIIRCNESTFVGSANGFLIGLYPSLTFMTGVTNNFQDGYLIGFNKNKCMDEYGKLQKGKSIGIWEHFDETGKLVQETDYSGDSPKIIFRKEPNGSKIPPPDDHDDSNIPPPPPPPHSVLLNPFAPCSID